MSKKTILQSVWCDQPNDSRWAAGCKGPVIRATFSCNLSCNNVAVASWDCLLRVLPPSRATNFHVAESRCRFYFLQHQNLLREKVVIRATNNLNLQRQHCCTTSCTKMLPVLLGLKCFLWCALCAVCSFFSVNWNNNWFSVSFPERP